jgi:tetratricopeptide (TPR) repeat protein
MRMDRDAHGTECFMNHWSFPMRKSIFAWTVALAGAFVALTGCTTDNEKYRNEGVKLYNEARAAEDGKDAATANAKYSEAMAAFEKSLGDEKFLSDSSTDPVSNAYKAAIHFRAGQYELAAYHARVSLQFDPSNDEAKTVMVASYIKQDKPDQALDALERLSGLADRTKDPRAEKSIGNRPFAKEAELRLYFSPVKNRYEIGRVYESLGDLDNAALWYGRALERMPDNTTVQLAMVKLYERAGNKPKLTEALRTAYAADPANPELLRIMTRNGLVISDVTSPR